MQATPSVGGVQLGSDSPSMRTGKKGAGGREGTAPAVLLHLPRTAYPVGIEQYGLAERGEEGGIKGPSVSRSQAHLRFTFDRPGREYEVYSTPAWA